MSGKGHPAGSLEYLVVTPMQLVGTAGQVAWRCTCWVRREGWPGALADGVARVQGGALLEKTAVCYIRQLSTGDLHLPTRMSASSTVPCDSFTHPPHAPPALPPPPPLPRVTSTLFSPSHPPPDPAAADLHPRRDHQHAGAAAPGLGVLAGQLQPHSGRAAVAGGQGRAAGWGAWVTARLRLLLIERMGL